MTPRPAIWIAVIFLLSSHVQLSVGIGVDGNIWQSNPIAGRSNTIYVTLSFNESVASGVTFTISGLTGVTISSPVQLVTASNIV
eukprot:752388-Hanusia_phi.AAC.1